MQQTVPARRSTPALIAIQAIVAGAYLYGVVAFLTTEAESFPEHAPPAWAMPAVLATVFGVAIGPLCLLVAGPLLSWRRYRDGNHQWPALAAATAASALMLAVMASPLGWEIFDWYVS